MDMKETNQDNEKTLETVMNETSSNNENTQEMIPLNEKSNLSNSESFAVEPLTFVEANSAVKDKKIGRGNKSTIFLLILSVLLVGSLAFGGYQTVSAIKYDKLAATNKLYYEQENKRANDLDSNIITLDDKIVKLDEKAVKLEEELSKTDAGKKALEEVNKNLENENGALDQKATTAEELMNKAKAELAAKQDELIKINSTLAAKKSELEKAQRGIAKFAEVEKLYISFKMKKDEFAVYNLLIIDNINSYFETGNQSYIDVANSNFDKSKIAYQEMETLNTQMNVLFDIIKSGSY